VAAANTNGIASAVGLGDVALGAGGAGLAAVGGAGIAYAAYQSLFSCNVPTDEGPDEGGAPVAAAGGAGGGDEPPGGAEGIRAARPFAMGLTDEGLDAFAAARNADTWKSLPDPGNWRARVLQKLADPATQVHFNLEGVDVWEGISRAAAGRGGPTDWELLQIYQNPQWWESIQFWKGGQPVGNPFQ
jgi:hypothetical protein